MRRRLCTLGALMLFGLLSSVRAEPSLQVDDAWVREGPPNAPVLAAFMTLRNPAAAPVEIAEVTSPGFARIEMHLSQTDGGMARMIRQEVLNVPAQGILELAPGGYHLMLFEPAQPVRAGQRVALTLHARDGRSIVVEAEVRSGMAGMGGMHQ